MSPADSPKAARTRAHLLDRALRRFRKSGFEKTTMRQIADDAGMSLGASYYYFKAKEDFLLAYYDDQQRRHREVAQAALANEAGLERRLAIALHTKLDILAKDRRLLGAVLHAAIDPSATTSVFSTETRATRAESVAIFREALEPADLPEDVAELASAALWVLHLGILLYFVRDDSPEQSQTRQLIDGGVALIAPMIGAASTPLVLPLLRRASAVLERAGLVLGREQ